MFNTLSLLTREKIIRLVILIYRVKSFCKSEGGLTLVSYCRSSRPCLGTTLISNPSRGTTYLNVIHHDAPHGTMLDLSQLRFQDIGNPYDVVCLRIYPAPRGVDSFPPRGRKTCLLFLLMWLFSCFSYLTEMLCGDHISSLFSLESNTHWHSGFSGFKLQRLSEAMSTTKSTFETRLELVH